VTSFEALLRNSFRRTEKNHEPTWSGYVGFEVLTAVVMKSTIFWGTALCSPFKMNDVSEEHIVPIFHPQDGGDVFLRSFG
jgi:hypothetical protein